MDWNNTLLWLVGLSAAIFAVRVVLQRPVPWGWAGKMLVILGTAVAGWWLFPDFVGLVLLLEWVVLILFPSMGQRLALRLIQSRRPRLARMVARLAATLHPFDGWSATRQFVEALAALQAGDAARGQRLLSNLQGRNSSLGRTALAMQVRQAADWSGFLQWIDSQPDRSSLLADNALVDIYLQALGETGRRREMLEVFALQLHDESHPAAEMRVAALSGEETTTQAFLQGPLQSWPRDMIDFWIATAQQIHGDPRAAATFERLQHSGNGLITLAASRRLSQPLSPLAPGELGEEARSTLLRLRRDVLHEQQFAVLSSTPYRRPWVTWGIAIVLTLMFGVELLGGAEDETNLIRLGAIVIPREPYFAEWWRPFSAAFLHFGWAHFLMNLFGLLFLGVRLERAWGWWRTLLCYVAAILVSMTVTPWLLEQSVAEPQILAGASGGIMGLLGGLLGHLLVGRWRRRTPQVAHQLSLLIGFVLLQTMFDLSHVEVSQQAHLLGLATGGLCGVVFALTMPQLQGAEEIDCPRLPTDGVAPATDTA
ncbi:MAG: rhomboid family intramembrane serine protease [Planctomycetaceae bacterium]